ETVTMTGRSVRLDGLSLVHPPREVPPVLAGVVRPRSLALSGRVAQGTVLPEGFGPDRVRQALDQIAAPGDHELVVFTHLHIGSGFPDQVLAGHAEFLGVSPHESAMGTGTASDAAAAVTTRASVGA